MSFTSPKAKAFSNAAFRLLMGAAAFGAIWLLIFSACQWAKHS